MCIQIECGMYWRPAADKHSKTNQSPPPCTLVRQQRVEQHKCAANFFGYVQVNRVRKWSTSISGKYASVEQPTTTRVFDSANGFSSTPCVHDQCAAYAKRRHF
jgi:hypothetical protein